MLALIKMIPPQSLTQCAATDQEESRYSALQSAPGPTLHSNHMLISKAYSSPVEARESVWFALWTSSFKKNQINPTWPVVVEKKEKKKKEKRKEHLTGGMASISGVVIAVPLLTVSVAAVFGAD